MTIENKEKEKLFSQYKDMIEQAAWQATKKYSFKVEFKEFQSEAYCIFCDAIERFDESAGTSFSTFLFNRLKATGDFGKLQYRNHAKKEKRAKLLAGPLSSSVSYATFESAMISLEQKIELSQDAKTILDFLVSREWENKENITNRVPHLHSVKAIFSKEKSWAATRTARAWAELKEWWNNNYAIAFPLVSA